MHVRLLPHYISGFENDDLDVCKKIYEKCKNKEQVTLIVTGSLKEFKDELNVLDLHISSKMHPTILATSNFIPAISVAYDHKQIGFYKNLGLRVMAVNLKELTFENLREELDYVWFNRAEIKKELEVKVPELQRSISNSMREAVMKCLS
jgi:polysaccharide pyruvyl transferase WcaK-like protein